MTVGIILGTILGGTICGVVVAIIYFYNQFTDITDEYDKLYGNYYRHNEDIRHLKKKICELELNVYALQNGDELPNHSKEMDNE